MVGWRKILKSAMVAVTLVAGVSAALAQDFKPVVVYDLGGKFDRSFNEAAFNGAEAFTEKTGVPYRDFEPTNEAQMQQALRRFTRRGADMIVAVGVGYAVPVRNLAKANPDQKFTVIDAYVDLPNVRSILFKEHEGSYLVGVLAGLKSDSGKVGVIGGMDIPLIRRFARGFEQGVRSVRPEAEIITNMVGTTPAAWNDPIRGAELARTQYALGVDVIFAPAGPTSLGVLQAAKDEGKFAIGVDSNQNHIQPGHVLTSMLKRVDVAVEKTLVDAMNGAWEPGLTVLGLAEGGVDYALDEHNRPLITAEMKAQVEAARAAIIEGDLVVEDAMGGPEGATSK